MNTLIREAVEKDLPSILNLYRQLGQDDGTVLELTAAQKIFRRMQDYPDYRLFLAEADGEIAGVFALLVMDNLGHNGAPSGVVEDVVVRSDLRGRGIGRTMMHFAMAYCRARGCYKMSLSSNMVREAAHRFYENLGFRRHGYSFFCKPDQTLIAEQSHA